MKKRIVIGVSTCILAGLSTLWTASITTWTCALQVLAAHGVVSLAGVLGYYFKSRLITAIILAGAFILYTSGLQEGIRVLDLQNASSNALASVGIIGMPILVTATAFMLIHHLIEEREKENKDGNQNCT